MLNKNSKLSNLYLFMLLSFCSLNPYACKSDQLDQAEGVEIPSESFNELARRSIKTGINELDLASVIANVNHIDAHELAIMKDFCQHIKEYFKKNKFNSQIIIYTYIEFDNDFWVTELKNNKFIIQKQMAPDHIVDMFNGHFSCRKHGYWKELYYPKKIRKRFSIPIKDFKYPIAVEVLSFN